MDEKAAGEIAARDGDSNEMGVVNPTLSKQGYLLKMDLRLIPILGCTYTILFLDRTNSKSVLSTSGFQIDKH
jgi:hypothetical protein